MEIGNAEEVNCEAESLALEERRISIPLSPPPSIPVPLPANSRAIPMVPSSIQTPWSTSVSSVPLEVFSSEVGPTVEIPGSPLEIFELFYTPQCFQLIVRESNRYAKEVMDNEKYESGKPIDVADLKDFLGSNIFMGLNQLPSKDDYWKRSPVYHYAAIAERISRYLHFVDNSTLASPGSQEYVTLRKNGLTAGLAKIDLFPEMASTKLSTA